ncbi:hypothetical protein [Rickettsia sp. TH2014]|uniref:hypothetical protein n=1 Tax=Rickettsia sp. TH2014 TaxID=1967503 RepID=UPI002114CD1B|nr:hypothetical protein [Rickettsia sp. TH2014]
MNSVPDSVIKGGVVYLGPNAILDRDSSNVTFTGYFNYVAPNALITPAPIDITGGVRFDDSDAVTDNGTYGKANIPLGIIQINGGDVTLTNQVYVNNVKFTTSNAVTLTLTNTSTVGGATTTGNKIHTLAITGDLTTGTSPFGSDSNHLKPFSLIVAVNSPLVAKMFTLVSQPKLITRVRRYLMPITVLPMI